MRISDWSSDVCSSDLQDGLTDMATIELSAPKLMENVTLRVRFVNVLRARIWVATRIIMLAGLVAGCNIEIEASEGRSEEHTSELQSLMRISYAVFCLKKKKPHKTCTLTQRTTHTNI